MTINQISIFLENRYGKLSDILTLLAEANIRIISATVADTAEFGIMRMIVSDPEQAFTILKENHVNVHMSQVMAIVTGSEVDNFAKTISLFTKAGLSIEYMYCFSFEGKSVLILRCNNHEEAREVIRRQNLDYLSSSDLINL